MKQEFLQIAPDGVIFIHPENPVRDKQLAHDLLDSLHYNEKSQLFAKQNDTLYFVEAFDQPLIVNEISLDGELLNCKTENYEYTFTARLDQFVLDDWDRFLVVSEKGIPAVLTEMAQEQLFNLCDSFEDDSITIKGTTYQTPHWLQENSLCKEETFWTEKYLTEQTGWELNAPAPALVKTLPQLKLSKLRVAVLGCGSGNDAAYFADQGHIVTAFDLSEEALNRARDKYGNKKNLEFVHKDIFKLDESYKQKFDLIFEHTCYCAIAPSMRNNLVKLWTRLLSEKGFLFGIFFSMNHPKGPPYGGSEWEVKKRLDQHFELLYWNRWRQSLGGRQGKEFVVYAQKKS
jgi:SAM-dependent methyltransferase